MNKMLSQSEGLNKVIEMIEDLIKTHRNATENDEGIYEQEYFRGMTNGMLVILNSLSDKATPFIENIPLE